MLADSEIVTLQPASDTTFKRMPATLLCRILFVMTLMVLASAPRADVLDDLLSTDSDKPATVAQDKIELESDARSDAEIRKRLLGIFAELDTTQNVDVTVASGIVTLGGTVATADGGKQATRIASQVKGVIEIVDTLTVDTNISRRVESTVGRLQASVLSTLSALPVFLLAVGIVVLFWWIGIRVGARKGVFSAIAPNGFIADLLSTLARFVVTFIGLVLALILLDATSIIGSVLGAAGIVGLAVGFAVRDTVENFIASILLSLRTPFLVRDYVQIGDHEGAVARLTSRATILITRDGNQVRVPNALVYKSVIVNFSRQPNRRFEFMVGVSTDLDLNAAQQTAIETIYTVEGVLADPPATALVSELGDSSVTLTIGGWINQVRSDVFKVRSEAIRQVKQAFDDAGFEMPEPIYRLQLRGLNHADDKLLMQRPDSGDDKSDTVRNVRNTVKDTSVTALCEEVSDTTVDESMHQSIERELADSGSENLLKGSVRTE